MKKIIRKVTEIIEIIILRKKLVVISRQIYLLEMLNKKILLEIPYLRKVIEKITFYYIIKRSDITEKIIFREIENIKKLFNLDSYHYDYKYDYHYDYDYDYKYDYEYDYKYDYEYDYKCDYEYDYKYDSEYDYKYDYKYNYKF